MNDRRPLEVPGGGRPLEIADGKRSDAFHVRPALSEDLDRIIEIHQAAYAGPETEVERRRGLTSHRWGSLDDLRVIEDARGIVGHGFLFTMRTFLGGKPVDVGGIGTVGVATEARRRGVGSALIEAMHAELRARGTPLALLYPFRETFYANLGYAPTTRLAQLSIAPSSLESIGRDGLGRGGSERDRRAVRLDGSRRAEILDLYHRALQRQNGWLVRPNTLWDVRFANEQLHFIGIEGPTGALAGYATFTYEPTEIADRPRIVVADFVAETESEAFALFSFLGEQRDQVGEVVLTMRASDPFVHRAFDATVKRTDLSLRYPIGSFCLGPMVHLVDSEAALAARGYESDGEIVVRVTECSNDFRHTDKEDANLRLVTRGGSAVEIARTSAPADVSIDRTALGAIVTNSLLPSEAFALGALQVRDRAVIAKADTLFAGPRFECLDGF